MANMAPDETKLRALMARYRAPEKPANRRISTLVSLADVQSYGELRPVDSEAGQQYIVQAAAYYPEGCPDSLSEWVNAWLVTGGFMPATDSQINAVLALI